MKQKFHFFILIAFLSFHCCTPDENDFKIGNNGKEFNCDILGVVLDEEGKPVLNAKVEFNGIKKTTDQFGVYHFNNVAVNVNHNFIRINIIGYFEGSRTFTTDRKTVIQLKNVLLKKEFIHSFNSISGGQVQEAAIKLIFPADAVAFESGGELYNGKVNLAVKYLDPWAETIINQMPGNMSGLSTTNDRMFLTSYGMAAIEMKSENGEKLQIAAGKKVQIITNIPDEAIVDAPASIPLWYFDEVKGFWIEEGSAMLEGNEYIGEVSHFSFWNCDDPFPIIILSGRVLDSNGNPFSGALIRVFQGGRYGYASTNGDGTFSGGIRKDEPFEITFQINGSISVCEQSQIILLGPSSEDVTIADIRLTNEGINNYFISSKVFNCSGRPVKNGYVIIFKRDDPLISWIYPIDEGHFGGSISTCNAASDIVMNFKDLGDLTSSGPIELNVTGNKVLSDIEACQNIEDFVTIVNPSLGLNEVLIKLDQQNYVYASNDITGILSAYRKSDSLELRLFWEVEGLGLQKGTFEMLPHNAGSPARFTYFDGQLSEFSFVSGKVTILQGGIFNYDVIGKYELTMQNKKTNMTSQFTGSFRVHIN